MSSDGARDLGRPQHFSVCDAAVAMDLGVRAHVGEVGLFVGLVVAAQVGALIVLHGQVSAVTRGVGGLLGLMTRDDRPSISTAAPVLESTIWPLLAVALVSLGVWAVVGLFAGLVVRRRMARLPVSLAWPTRAGLAVLWTLILLLALFAAMAVASPWLTVERFNVRGSAIAVVLPNATLLSAVLISWGATFVVCLVATLAADWGQVSAARRGEPVSPCGGPLARTGLEGAVGGALLVVAAILVCLGRPVSDDYRVLALARDQSFMAFMRRHLTAETGRYAQGIWNWLVCRGAGVHATQVTGLVLLALLWAACVLALRTWVLPHRSLGSAMAMGALLAAVGVWSVPSFGDGFVWFTAADVYVPGVVCLVFAAVAVWRLRVAVRVRLFPVLATLVLVAVACGFYEATTVLAVLGAAALAVTSLKSRRQRLVQWAVLVVALAGLAVMAFAPAQRARADAAQSSSLLVALVGGVYSCLHLVCAMTPADWFLMVGAGFGLGSLLRSSMLVRQVEGVLLAGALLVGLIPPVCGAVGFYGLAWAGWRMYTPQGLLFAWGVVFLVAGVVLAWSRTRGTARGGRETAPVVAAVMLVAGLALLISQATGLAMAL